MLFLNPWLLAGLAGVLVPIILHLIRRQAAKPYDWGAMRFLFDTVAMRRRRMEWEDMLLMAARCLLIGLLALAVARPFVPPDSTVPWMFVLPLALLGIAALGASFVLTRARFRWLTRGVALALILLAAGLIVVEKFLNLRRFQTTGSRDIALVIDASSSMSMPRGGQSAFDLAVEEATRLVKDAPRGTSFSVILGGPAPEMKTGSPLSHRADVIEVLESLRPIGGPFQAHDALGMAVLNLNEGYHGAKEIIVFTDGQKIGWRLESPSAWNSLGEALDALPRKPKLLVREFPPPEALRNVAVSGIDLSREVIGTDREVTIRVGVENTGTEAVTPEPLELEIDGKVLEPQAVGQLAPGQEESVEFRHRFEAAGAAVLTARLEVKDDLRDDDRFERVVPVKRSLPVLLIDGNPTGSFFERAAGFTALALAPTELVTQGADAGEDFLMDPSVVPAPEIGVGDAIDAAEVIVLADVTRLPAGVADRLANHVARGAGLLVVAGPRSDPGFYNAWKGAEGPVSPVRLDRFDADREGVSPAAATFEHEVLGLFRDEKKSDLGEAVLAGFRRTGDVLDGGVVAGRFTNGEPFLAARQYGHGKVVIAMCSFDARSGNLMTRQSFVPFVHELVAWLAGGGGLDLNVEASWNPAVDIPGGGGLLGTYRRGSGSRTRTIGHRFDPLIDFDWGSAAPGRGMPRDDFSVTWMGSLLAPVSGRFEFTAEVDDELEFKIDGKRVLRSSLGAPERGEAELQAGKPVPVEIRFREDSGDAHVRLFWKPPGGERSLVPSSALVPISTKGSAELETSEATDPRGARRKARLALGRRGRMLEVEGAAIPGLYRLKVPPAVRDDLDGLAGEMLPFVVRRDVRESRLTTMNEEDRDMIRERIDLVEARSVEDVLAVLDGKGFGQELWRLLAVAAFFLLLGEVALARWISKSRRSAEDVRIDFEDRGGPDSDVLAAMKKMRRAG
ncbi:MAG: VWA domain-containing protein [Akkermansiaceae bacterium]|nr:VWA domain-containing protein [Akkermansiaceae bacterium]